MGDDPNKFAIGVRDQRRKRIVNALDEYALKSAARDCGLVNEAATMSKAALREYVLAHWDEAEDAIYRYLDGARS